MNVNQVDNREWTPLDVAVYYGHREIVDILLSYDADTRMIENLHKKNTSQLEDHHLLETTEDKSEPAYSPAQVLRGLDAEGDEKKAQHKLDEALDAYRKALFINPMDRRLRRKVISICWAQEDYEGGIREYLGWARTCKNNAALQDARIIYKEILGLHKQAENNISSSGKKGKIAERLRDIIIEVKNEIESHLEITTQKVARHSQQSIKYLNECLAKAPHDARVHINLGRAYMKKNMNREAIAQLQEVIRLSPSLAPYAYEMLAEASLRTTPANQVIHQWLKKAGALFHQNSQLEDSIRIYEKLHKLIPQDKNILEMLFEVSQENDDNSRALHYADRLVAVYQKEKLTDRVVDLYEKIIKLNPDNARIRNNLINIYRQILTIDPGNLTTRRKLIGNLLNSGASLEAAPEIAIMARECLKKGMLDDAFAACESLLELDPHNVEIKELLKEINARRLEKK